MGPRAQSEADETEGLVSGVRQSVALYADGSLWSPMQTKPWKDVKR